MNTAEKLDQEADELWKQHMAPEAGGSDDEPGAEDTDLAAAQAANEFDQAHGQAADRQAETSGGETAGTDADRQQSGPNWEERYQNAQALMTRATQEAADLRKQVEPLKQENGQLKQALDQLKGEMEQLKQAAPAKQDTPPVEDADLDSLLDTYPEIVGPLVQQVRQMSAALNKLTQEAGEMRGTVTTATEKMQQREEEVQVQAHWARIEQVHADAREIAQQADFHGWVQRQPAMVQQAVAQGTSDDVIWVLNQYKAAVGDPNDLSEARRALTPNTPRARRQPTNPRPKFTRAQIDAMSPQEYAAREAEIDAAMVAGLIE